MSKKILVVAAHPDDEILGCGGTIARFVKEGCEVEALILGEGVTSRDEKRNAGAREEELKNLQEAASAASEVLGVNRLSFESFPDNRFDSVPLLDIVKKIENAISRFKPDTILTHASGDLNVDHRITYQAVLTATRPTQEQSVREIYSFEVLSSTEWQFPNQFDPDCFYDISETISQKLGAMEHYESELRPYPHPRSLEGIQKNAEVWGMKVGVPLAEAFKVVRKVQ